METKKNVYEIVTDRIIEQIQQGIIPWRMPWVGAGKIGAAISYKTQKPYSMLNQMLLGRPGEWITWNEIQALGGKVKKGAKSGIYVFYSPIDVEVENKETGKVEVEQRFVLKWYRAFHLSDTEGIKSKLPEEPVAAPKNNPIEVAENVVSEYVKREGERLGFRFQNDRQSSKAYYSPSEDKVVVPMLEQFISSEEYYSTTFHELVHSTLHEKRCNRKAENKLAAFGSADYSREELVAECGSAMLCNRIGIEIPDVFKNSVAYIQGWLRKLRGDSKAIVYAAVKAEKAAKFILNEAE